MGVGCVEKVLVKVQKGGGVVVAVQVSEGCNVAAAQITMRGTQRRRQVNANERVVAMNATDETR